VVFKRGINIRDKYFLVEISQMEDGLAITAFDIESPDSYTLELDQSEAIRLMGGEPNYERLVALLAFEGEELILVDHHSTPVAQQPIPPKKQKPAKNNSPGRGGKKITPRERPVAKSEEVVVVREKPIEPFADALDKPSFEALPKGTNTAEPVIAQPLRESELEESPHFRQEMPKRTPTLPPRKTPSPELKAEPQPSAIEQSRQQDSPLFPPTSELPVMSDQPAEPLPKQPTPVLSESPKPTRREESPEAHEEEQNEVDLLSQVEQQIPQEERQIPQVEQQIPQEERQIPQVEQQIPLEESQIPQVEQQIPQEERQIPHEEQQIPQEERLIPQEEQSKPLTLEETVPPPKSPTPPIDAQPEATHSPTPAIETSGIADIEATAVEPREEHIPEPIPNPVEPTLVEESKEPSLDQHEETISPLELPKDQASELPPIEETKEPADRQITPEAPAEADGAIAVTASMPGEAKTEADPQTSQPVVESTAPPQQDFPPEQHEEEMESSQMRNPTHPPETQPAAPQEAQSSPQPPAEFQPEESKTPIEDLQNQPEPPLPEAIPELEASQAPMEPTVEPTAAEKPVIEANPLPPVSQDEASKPAEAVQSSSPAVPEPES
jgi:hypothetical protein